MYVACAVCRLSQIQVSLKSINFFHFFQHIFPFKSEAMRHVQGSYLVKNSYFNTFLLQPSFYHLLYYYMYCSVVPPIFLFLDVCILAPPCFLKAAAFSNLRHINTGHYVSCLHFENPQKSQYGLEKSFPWGLLMLFWNKNKNSSMKK